MVEGNVPGVSATDKLKTPARGKFKAVEELQVSDLPNGWQCQEALDAVGHVSQRVVMIYIPRMSSDRPANIFSDSPHYGGTGFAYHVDEDIVKVRTNLHVIYNAEEASQATVQFSLRVPGKRHTRVVRLQASSRSFVTSEREDFSSFTCVTSKRLRKFLHVFRDVPVVWDTPVFGKTVSEERTVSTALVDPEEEDRPLTSSTDSRCQITRTTHECLLAQDLDKDRVRTAWEGDRRWLDSDPDQREMNHHDDERQDPVSASAVGEEGILPEDNGGRGPAEHCLSHHCVEMTSFRHDQCKERRGKGVSTYQDTFERSCETNRCLRPALERGDFVAILSHPQGSSKCFSVGPAAEFDQQSHMKQRNTSCLTRTGCDHSAKDPTSVEDVDLINERLEACKNRIYYTQSTFGCSGAPVLLFKKSLQHTKIPVVDYSQHSGTCYFRDGIHLGFSTRFSPPACNSCERTPSELKECYSVLRQQEQILHLQEQTRRLKSEHCPSPAEATHIVHAGIVAITGDRNLEAVVTRRAPTRQHCIDHWESRHTVDSHYICPKSHLTNASWTSQNSLFTETCRTYDEYGSPQSKDELAINGLSSEDRSTKGMSEISPRDGFLDFGTEDGCDVSCVNRGCCIEHGSDENHHSPPVFNVDHGVCTLEGHSPDKRYPGKQPRNGRRPPRHRRPETQNPTFRNYATQFNQRRPHLRMHPPSAERRRYEYQNWTDNNQRFRPHVPFFRHANSGQVHSMRTTSKAVPDRQVYDSLGGQSLFEDISVSDTPLQDLLNPEQRNTRQTLTAEQSFVNSYTSLDAHSSLNLSANSVSLCYSPTADNLSEQCLDDSRGMPTVENYTNEDWSDKSTTQGKGEHEDVVYTLANSSPVCTSSASIHTQDINYRFYNIERTEERYEKAAMQSVRPETPEQLICKPGELEEAGTTFQSPGMTPNSQLFPANTPDNEGGSDQVDEARTFQSPEGTSSYQLYLASIPDNKDGLDQQQEAGTTFQPPEGTLSYQLFPASIPDNKDGLDQQQEAGTTFQPPEGTPIYQLFPASTPDNRDGTDQQDQAGTIFPSPVGTPIYQLFPAGTSYKDGSDQVMEAGTAFQSPERTPNYQLFPADIPDKDGSDQVVEAGTTFQSPEGTPSYLFFLESISDSSDDQDQEEEAGTTFQSPSGTPSYQLFLESISDNSDDQNREEEAGTTFRSPEGTPSYQLFLESISDNSDDQDQQESGTTFQPPDGTSSYQLFPGSVPDNKDGSDQMQEWIGQNSYSVPLTEDHVRNLDLSANLPSLFSNRSNDLHTQTSTNALTIFADPMLTNTSTVSDNQLIGTSDATSERVLAHETQSANSLPTGSKCSSQPLDANDSFQTLEKLVESLSTAQETTAVAKSARSSPESDCHPQPAVDEKDLSNCTALFDILTKPPSRGNVVRPDTEGNVDKQEDSGRKQASVCQAFDLHSEQSLKLENESSNGYETKNSPEMSMGSQVSESQSTEKSGNQQSVTHLRLAPKDTPRRVNREMHSLHHLKVLKHERKQMRRKKRFAPKFPDQKLKSTPAAEKDSTSQEFLSGLHQMEERFLNLSPLRVKDFDGREMQKLGLKRLEQYHMEIERLKLTSRPEDQNENLSCAYQNCPLPPYSKSRREPKRESTDGPHDTDIQSRLSGPGQEIMDPHLKTKAHRTLQNSTVTSGLRIDRPVARESVSANHNAQMHKKVEQRQWPAETWQSGVMKTESQQRMAAAIQQQAFQTPFSANAPASSSRDISSDKKPISGPSNGNDNNLAHQFTRSPLDIRDNSSTQTIKGVPSNSRDTSLVPQLTSLVNSRDNSLVQQNIRHPFNIRDNNSVQQLTHNSSHAGIPGSTFPRHIDNRSGQYNATGFATGHQPSAFASQPLGDMPVQEPAGDQTNASNTNFANQYLFQHLYETAKRMFDFHYHQSPRQEIMYPESGVDMRLEPSQVHKGTQYNYRSNSRAENAPFAIQAQGDPPSQVHEGTQYNYRSNSRAENAPFAIQAQGDPTSQVHKGTQYNYRSNSRAENAPFAIQAQGDPPSQVHKGMQYNYRSNSRAEYAPFAIQAQGDQPSQVHEGTQYYYRSNSRAENAPFAIQAQGDQPSQVHEGTQYYYRSNSRAENAPFAIQAQGDPHLLRFRQMQAGQRTGFSQDPTINTTTFSGAPVYLPNSTSFSGQLPQPLNTDPSYYVAERRLECSHLDCSLGSTSILSSSTDSSYSSSSECSDHSLSEAEEMPGSPDQTQPSTSGPNVCDLFDKTSHKDAGTDATNCTSPDLAGKKWKENVLPSSTAKESSQHHEYRLFDVTSVVGVVLEMGVVRQDSDPAFTMLPQTSQLQVVQPGVQTLSVSDNELQSNHAQGAGSFDLESIHMVDKFLREACSPSQKQVYRSYKPTAGNVGHSLWKPNHVSGCCQTGNNLLHSEQNFFGMAETNPQLAHGQSRYHTNESSAHVPHYSTKSTCSTSHRPWVLSGNVSEVWNGLSGKHNGDLTQDSPADQNQLRRVYFNTAPTLLSVHGKVIGMTHFTPGTDPNQNMQQSVSAHPYCQQGDIMNTGSLWSQGALCHPSIRPVYHSHPHVCMPPVAFPVHHSVPSGSMCDRVSRHTQPNAHHFRSMSESSQPAYSSPSTDHQLSLQPRSQSSSNDAHEAGAHNLLSSQPRSQSSSNDAHEAGAHNLLSSQPRSQSSSNDAHEVETAQSQGPCSDNMDGGVVQTACVATTDSLDTSFLVTLEEMDIVRNISLERQAEDVVDRSAQVSGGSNSRQRLYTKNERAKRTKLRYRKKKWQKAEKLPLEKRYRLRYQQAAENSTSDEEPSENSPLLDPKTEPAFKQDKGLVLDSASTSGTSDREVCYVTVPVDIRVRLEKAAKWITTQMFGCPQVHYLTPSDAHTFRLQQNLHLTMQVMTLKG